ncbi:MAG TPA: leucine/isoleucine/valine transporter permease subunit [Candidatus Limnocylindria bacterium]|jgi:branched-chain amino acid transport system permease protein|nr:leucine/isoleucine/valine transporter permease subunit [Candidatus Limnocylindria bacterium]
MNPLLRRALITGVLGGAAGIHVSLVGMVEDFQGRDTIADIVTVGTMLPILIAILVGSRAASRMRAPLIDPTPRQAVLLGAVAGAVTGAVLALLALFVNSVDVAWILSNAKPSLADLLWLDQGPVVGSVILLAGGALFGALGGVLHVLPAPIARAVAIGGAVTIVVALMEPFLGAVLRNVGLRFLEGFLYASGGLTLPGFILVYALVAGGVYFWRTRGTSTKERVRAMPADRRRIGKVVAYLALIGLLLLLPQIVGSRLSEVVGTIGLYVLLGLGLNIVVGFAGLLDLGYVAFYAVGAYTTAVLTSPASPLISPELPFWGALPFVIVAAAMIGLMVGAPVLRLRGDYLAIVTLGFGEIARLIFLSEWAKPIVGGAQGILSIPPPLPFTNHPQVIYYPILFFCILAAIAASRLAASRVGRAWNAMREDESVAEATGVNTIRYKLLAFGLGAAFGCLSGAFFAAKIGTIFPNSFEILVSINALALIILGGMGNIYGVVVGAFVLVGLPELLREFAEYRLLIYGAVLVVMMLLRPEGLLPSRSRRAELHEDQGDDEVMYEHEAGVDTGRPVVTG